MYCERQLRAPLTYSPRCILVGYLCPQWMNESCLGNRFNRVCKRPRCSTAGSRSITVQTMGDKHLEKKSLYLAYTFRFQKSRGYRFPHRLGKRHLCRDLKNSAYRSLLLMLLFLQQPIKYAPHKQQRFIDP